MAGTKSEGVGKAVKDFRDLGLAIAGVKTQFRAIISPIQGCVNELQKLAKVSDMSLTSGASVQNIKVFGAALKALGGDAGSAAKTFGFLDSQVTKMKLGESNQLGDLAWKFNFRLTGTEKPEEQFDAVRKAMSGLSEAGKREFSRALGLDESMFRLATMAAEEYDEVKKRAERMNFDTNTQKEMTEDALKMREALGNLSSAWSKLWSGVGSIFAKAAPLINWIAEAIAWIANFKGVLWGLALVISAVVGVNILRFIGALKKLLQVMKMIPSIGDKIGKIDNWFTWGQKAKETATSTKSLWQTLKSIGTAKDSGALAKGFHKLGSVIRHPIRSLKELAEWSRRIGKIDVGAKLAKGWHALGRGLKAIVTTIRHPIESIKTLIQWLSKIGTAKDSGALAKGFRAVASAIRHPIQAVKTFFGWIRGGGAALKGVVGSFKAGLAVVGGLFKGILGIVKGIFGGIIGAALFAINGVTFAFTQFKKYIWDNLSEIGSFFTDTIPQMFSSFGDFFSILGGMWSGFFEGLGDGISDAFRNLLNFFTLGFVSEGSLDKITDWFMEPIRALSGYIAHPIDTIQSAWEGMLGEISDSWKKVRSWLPSWLGGYSDEEKKQIEEAEKNGNKKIDTKKTATISDEDRWVAWVDSPDIKERGQWNLGTRVSDAANNMYGAMSVAGENLKAVNSAAAGASNMVQTTNDNRSSVSNSATNTSVKVDNININSKADNPEKLGVELKSALNAYTNYGLSVSTSLAGQS